MRKAILYFVCLVSTASAQDWGRIQLSSSRSSLTSGTHTTHLLDSSDDWIEYVNQAPEPVTYTKLCYRTGTLTGAQPTFKIGVEGVSTTTGRADGVYASGTGECSATFTPSGNNTWACQTLTGTTCALTRGQFFAITIRYSSGTIGGSNSAGFAYTFSDYDAFSDSTTQLNYSFTVANGVGTKRDGKPVILWGTGSSYWGEPINAANGSAMNGGQEYGNVFTVPCPAGKTYKIIGARGRAQTPAAGKTAFMRLYSGTNTTPIQEVTWDSDLQAVNAGTRGITVWFDETTLESLNCNSPYRITFGTADTTTSFSLFYFDVASADYMSAVPFRTTMYSTARNAGAFSDTTTRRYLLEPIIDSMEITSGGGLKGLNSVSGGAQ